MPKLSESTGWGCEVAASKAIVAMVMPTVMLTVGRLSAGRHLAHRPSEVALSNEVPHCAQTGVGFLDSMKTQAPELRPGFLTARLADRR